MDTYLIEDSPVIREHLTATLEELTPVRVVGVAAEEATATRWLQDPSHRCDLVIVDLVLEGGSGLGVLRGADTRHDQRRFVVLTNYASDEMRERCAELGAERVFDKSNELDALIDYCSAGTPRSA